MQHHGLIGLVIDRTIVKFLELSKIVFCPYEKSSQLRQAHEWSNNFVQVEMVNM